MRLLSASFLAKDYCAFISKRRTKDEVFALTVAGRRYDTSAVTRLNLRFEKGGAIWYVCDGDTVNF